MFEHLPQATLAAIVIVAIAGFFDVAGIRRLARIRRSAVVFAGLALAGVLALGVLQGLIVTAGLSLVYVVARLSRPTVTELRREDGEVVVRIDAPLFYPNANAVKDQVLALAEERARRGASTSRPRPSSTCRAPTRCSSWPRSCAGRGRSSGSPTCSRRRSTSCAAPA